MKSVKDETAISLNVIAASAKAADPAPGGKPRRSVNTRLNRSAAAPTNSNTRREPRFPMIWRFSPLHSENARLVASAGSPAEMSKLPNSPRRSPACESEVRSAR